MNILGKCAAVVVTATLTAACASGSNEDVDTGRRGDLIPVGALLEQCPTVVEGDGEGSLTVSVSNATLVDSDPMVVALAVDGTPVLCEAVLAGDTEVYTDFTVPVTREGHVVTVDVWTDGDPEAGFRVRAFSTNRDVDPVETPFLLVERRHAPPEASVIYVRATDRLPG